MNWLAVTLFFAIGAVAFGEPAVPGGDAGLQQDMQKWLAALDAQWQPIFARDVTAVYEADLAKVRQQYLLTLEANMAKATQAGNLDQTLMWKKERDRLTAARDVPAEDGASDPPELKAARSAFRAQAARVEKERSARARALFDRYDQALAKAQTQLTQQQRIDDALAVRTEREKIAEAWGLDTKPATTVAATSESRGDVARPAAANPGELKIISATFGDHATGRIANVTRRLQKVLASGQPALVLRTEFIAEGKDPAKATHKQTTISYSINGETKKKTFPESYNLNFKDDLN